MAEKDADEFPKTYVNLARIQEIRRKMMHGGVDGTPEQLPVAKEVWYKDLPDLLETLEGMHRGDHKEKWASLGCMSGIGLTFVGLILAGMIVFGASDAANALVRNAKKEAETVQQEAGQRCAELGGTYAVGGAKVGERTVYCIFRQAVPPQVAPAATP